MVPRSLQLTIPLSWEWSLCHSHSKFLGPSSSLHQIIVTCVDRSCPRSQHGYERMSLFDEWKPKHEWVNVIWMFWIRVRFHLCILASQKLRPETYLTHDCCHCPVDTLQDLQKVFNWSMQVIRVFLRVGAGERAVWPVHIEWFQCSYHMVFNLIKMVLSVGSISTSKLKLYAVSINLYKTWLYVR